MAILVDSLKEVEDDLAAQQIYREILHISVTGEKVGKYNRQYCHHQKRIQHRPKEVLAQSAGIWF